MCHVNPPIAVLLGAWLLQERVGAQAIAAMALILVGVLLISASRTRG